MTTKSRLENQTSRRRTYKRIDYYPSNLSIAILSTKRTPYAPCNSFSGILDAILEEWANHFGGNTSLTSISVNAASIPELINATTRARLTSENTCPDQGRACHAKTRSGHPCRSKPCPGNTRCKWHGGMSTGPKSTKGKARSLLNLRQYKRKLQPYT